MTQKQSNRDALISYLDSQGWKYSIARDDEEVCFVRLGMDLRSKIGGVNMVCIADGNFIQSFALCPIKADDETKDKAVEFITRANYGLKQGKFEFDYSDGEIRFQSALCSMTDVPSHEEVELVVDAPFMMFNRYGDGLAKILLGFGDPETEITLIEG